jgi:hypothetical protein
LEPDPLTDSQEGPRLNSTSGQGNRSDGVYFGVIHGLRPVSSPHNSYHAWSHQNREALVGVELAKDVPGKQSHFNFGDPINTFAFRPIRRRKNAVTLDSQTVFDRFFMSRSNV